MAAAREWVLCFHTLAPSCHAKLCFPECDSKLPSAFPLQHPLPIPVLLQDLKITCVSCIQNSSWYQSSATVHNGEMSDICILPHTHTCTQLQELPALTYHPRAAGPLLAQTLCPCHQVPPCWGGERRLLPSPRRYNNSLVTGG